jgi:hypothetical protein
MKKLNKGFKMKTLLLLPFIILGLSACSGIQKDGDVFETHAESFNLLYVQIPGGDTQARASKLIPTDGEILTVRSTTSDNSLLGVFNRILGVDQTKIGGVIKTNDKTE